jgi:hypothetical protein
MTDRRARSRFGQAMPVPLQDKPKPDREIHERQLVSAAIARHVTGALRQPVDFLGVQVRRLWREHYRVNVLAGPDAASARIVASYFLVTDGAGKITASTPEIAIRSEPIAPVVGPCPH